MAKTKISEFSNTPGNNTDIDSINIAEGCAPSGINDAIRELMAQLKDFQTGAQGDSFNGPVGTTTAAAGAFTTLSASGTTTLSGLTASTALALDASKNVVSVTNTGTGNNVLATSPTLVTPILGTPTSVTLTNATGLPISTGVSGLGTGIATALAVNVGSAGAPVINGGALGTPSSGTVTNLTGTASININGTVGATTPTTGAFTTLTTSSTVTLNGGVANGVAYLNGSKVLTTGSALTFDGTTLSNTGSGDRAKFGTGSRNIYIAGDGGGVSMLDGAAQTGNGWYISGASNYVAGYVSSSEQMRLTSTGLGIGTSSPGYKLAVSTAASITVADFASTASGDAAFIGIKSSGGTYAYIGTVGGAMHFQTPGSGYSTKMTLDSSGNLGLGVTPSAWIGSYRALNIGDSGLVSSRTGVSINNIEVGVNWLRDTSGSFVYKANGYGTNYQQVDGAHTWYTAASGTAGNAISFTQALSLTAAGNLLLGGTTDPGGTKVLYIGNGTTPGTPTSGGVLYVESGALKYKGSSGTVTTLGAA